MIVYSCTRALAGTTWCGYLWCLSPRMVRSYCHYYARIFCLERQKKTTCWGWHWEASPCNQDSQKQKNSMHWWYNNIATSDLFDECNSNIGHGWKHVRHTKGYFSSIIGVCVRLCHEYLVAKSWGQISVRHHGNTPPWDFRRQQPQYHNIIEHTTSKIIIKIFLNQISYENSMRLQNRCSWIKWVTYL